MNSLDEGLKIISDQAIHHNINIHLTMSIENDEIFSYILGSSKVHHYGYEGNKLQMLYQKASKLHLMNSLNKKLFFNSNTQNLVLTIKKNGKIYRLASNSSPKITVKVR